MGEDATIDVPDLFNDESSAGESPATTEPSAEETTETKPEVEEPKDSEDPEAEPKEEDDKPEADDSEEAEVEEPKEEPKPRTVEARKAQLETEIRQFNAQKNELRDQIRAMNAQIYQAQTAEELIEQGEDPTIARTEALEQKIQMAEYNAHVTDLNAQLEIESRQVMSDYPMFDPESPDFDANLAKSVNALYVKSAKIQTNENTGLVEQVAVSPYEFYKTIADTLTASAQKGEVAGQRASDRQLANTDTPPVIAPKAPKVDPLLELWKD